MLLLSSCTFDFRDVGRTGVTTGIVYAAGGIVPAVVAGVTTSTYDVIVQKDKDLAKVQNKHQADVVIRNHKTDMTFFYTILSIIVFLICATFCRVWLTGIFKFIKGLFKQS